MNVIRWVTRIEYGLCLLGLVMLCALLLMTTCYELATGQVIDWATQAATVGLLLVALFGIGPAAAHGAHLRLGWLDRLCPESFIGRVERIGYGLTAFLFFVLFCLATYTSSETRATAEDAPLMGLPLWLLQALLVLAFGFQVLRFSVYSADPGLRPGDNGRSIMPPYRDT